MTRKLTKLIAWLGGAVGLVALFYLVLLAINWREVSPSEEALRFAQMYANRPPVSDDDNAFVYMVGMGVQAGYEPMLAGKAMLTLLRATKGEPTTPMAYRHPDFPAGDFVGERGYAVKELLDSCRSVDEKCAQFLDGNSSAVQLSASDRLQLERYRVMTKMSAWQDISPQGFLSPAPPYDALSAMQTLSMFRTWKDASPHRTEEIMRWLDADAVFWRMVLNSSDSKSTSMRAAAALRRNLLWTNLIVRRLANKFNLTLLHSTWWQPVNDEERMMERVWSGEFIWLDLLFKEAVNHSGREMLSTGDDEPTIIDDVGYYLIGQLYNPQDASNRVAMRYDSLVDLSKVPIDHLFGALYEWTQQDNARVEKERAFPRMFYNPAGQLMVNTAQAGEQSFLLVLPNLEGGRRALLATLEVRKDNIPREKVAEALSASLYRNPYTNEPFKWDEATGSVVFEGLGRNKDKTKRYSFIY